MVARHSHGRHAPQSIYESGDPQRGRSNGWFLSSAFSFQLFDALLKMPFSVNSGTYAPREGSWILSLGNQGRKSDVLRVTKPLRLIA